eukprot:SAG11_NODE_766_length_7274_cov_11.526690_7_plen_84_part_00
MNKLMMTVPVLRLPFLVPLSNLFVFLERVIVLVYLVFVPFFCSAGMRRVFYFMSGAYAPGVLFYARCVCAGCFIFGARCSALT